MGIKTQTQKIIAITLLFFGLLANAKTEYNCSQPRPEMSGFHNMVLFGHPDDQIYAYHLPLFAQDSAEPSPHTLMHVYQGLWKVTLDPVTQLEYEKKFHEKKSAGNTLPFFSIAPRGKRFKVPEMICNKNFSMQVMAAYGHVESNPEFPAPEPLIGNNLSVVTKTDTVFARRFDASSKDILTYFVFGNEKQYYMAHYITDDESSFDQIVAVNIKSEELKTLVNNEKFVEVSVSSESNSNLVAIPEYFGLSSVNNKLHLQIETLGQIVTVESKKAGVKAELSITADVYFNKNADLRK